jgi:hypothetical protein
MGLDTQNLETPPKPGSPEARVATAPVTRSDQNTWFDSNKSGIASAHRVMDRAGLSNVELTDNTKSSDKSPTGKTTTRKDLIATRDSLTRTAKENLSASDLSTFSKNMETFEQRAKRDHLSDSEIQATYQSVDKLLSAPFGSVYVKDRNRLAQQVMELAANPMKAKNGFNDTCGPSALETVVYMTQPSVAADLITQSALTGKYHAQNGTTIPVDLTPTHESDNPTTYTRGYASQIFQAASLNLGLRNQGSSWTYHDEHGPLAKGQASDYYTDAFGKRQPFPGTNADDLIASYTALTGKNDLTIIDNSSDESDNIKHANSPQDLERILANTHMPIIVGVDVRNQPFWNERGSGYAVGADPNTNWGHWSTVTAYDPSLNSVTYSNSWDTISHQISPQDLFRATRQAGDNLPDMNHDFLQSLKGPYPDYGTALDALRIRSETGRISNTDLNRLFDRDVAGLIGQRHEHSLDDRTVRHDVVELGIYLLNHRSFNPSPRVRQFLIAYVQKHLHDED